MAASASSSTVASSDISTRPPVRGRIALLGLGRVGAAVAARAAAAGFECTAALVRDPARHTGAVVPLATDGRRVIDAGADVVVEALGGVEPARSLAAYALERGIPVVTANKSLMAACGEELRSRAGRTGAALRCEAAVVAGVPFVGALASRPGLSSAVSITAILNGTSHAIACAMAAGVPFAAALADAQARGFAEPDSAADVSGRDAAEKLCVLLHLCGVAAAPSDIVRQPLDAVTPADIAAARALDGAIKPIAQALIDDPDAAAAWTGPAFVPRADDFSRLSGVTNAVRLSYRASGPITFSGPGAGPDVTAATILDDVAEVMARGPQPAVDARPRRRIHAGRQPDGPWFLRIENTAATGAAHVAEFLAARNLPALRIARAGEDALAVLTAAGPFRAAADAARALTAIGCPVACFPALAAPVDRS